MTYQPRALRVAAAFPLTYVSQEDMGLEIEGNCLNISESGLLGDFAQCLELWTKGELLLHFGGSALGLRVRVARVNGREAGVVFLFEDNVQRQTIAEVVASALSEMTRSGYSTDVPF